MALNPLNIMGRLRLGFAFACLGVLLGCGNAADAPLVTAVRTAGSIVTSGFGGGDDAPTGPELTAATVPQVLLDQIEGPLILVETPQLGGVTLMSVVGQNSGITTWQSPEEYSVALTDQFLLRSTRGLATDLMTSDVRPTAAALSARRSGPVDRLWVTLDGDVQELRQVHACNLVRNGRETVTIVGRPVALERMTETCQAPFGEYENIYWLDGAGRAIQSFQWVSPMIGHMRISVLRR